jgi:hypothetical protein
MTTDELLSAITAELSAIGAATDLGLISQDGEWISTVLKIDDRRFCLSLEPAQADTQLKAGHDVEAMKAVEEGLAMADATGEHFYSAELHRLQGELLARLPQGQRGKAEAAFRVAIEIAKEQGARTLEHKANESVRRWSGY